MQQIKKRKDPERLWTTPKEWAKEKKVRAGGKAEAPKDWHCRIYRQQWQNHFSELTPIQRCLWVSLKLYSGSNGKAWPSRTRLAKDLGVSVSTIKRNLKTMKQKKFIEIQKQNGRVNVFVLREKKKRKSN